MAEKSDISDNNDIKGNVSNNDRKINEYHESLSNVYLFSF